jgi:glycerol-3-phosphate cytidylyltransferase
MTIVITFGTYDLLHVGHVNILQRAAQYGDTLVVGVSSDRLNFEKKAKYPVYNETDRVKIIKSLRCVGEVFVEDSLELKRQYILDHGADILIMGDDWEGKFDHLGDICKVIYLPRTEGISSTSVKSFIYNSVSTVADHSDV